MNIILEVQRGDSLRKQIPWESKRRNEREIIAAQHQALQTKCLDSQILK